MKERDGQHIGTTITNEKGFITFLFVLWRIINEFPSKDGDVTEHAKCLQLILTLGLTIGV